MHLNLIIAYFAADKNDVDRYYLPEHYIPNLKLFPKGDKKDLISFPNSKERRLPQFISFLEHFTGIKIMDEIDGRAPAYFNSHAVQQLLKNAGSAVMFAIKKRVLKSEVYLKQYLAMYFTDPKCFPVEELDVPKSQPVDLSTTVDEMLDINVEFSAFLLASSQEIIKSELKYVQPDDPWVYLASRLQQIPVEVQHDSTRDSTHLNDTQLWVEALKAIKTHNHHLLKSLLHEKGLTPNQNLICRSIDDSLVCLASGYGNDAALEVLYSNGFNLNELLVQEGSLAISPVEIAATVGHEKVVRILLEKGVPFRNSLAHAAQKGNAGVVRLLLEYAAHPDIAMDKVSPLVLAVTRQHDSVIQALVEFKAQVDYELTDDVCQMMKIVPKSSVLHFAAKLGFISSVKAILLVWPDGKNKKNQAGKTPFELAPVEVKCYLEQQYLDTLLALRGSAIGGREQVATYQLLKEIISRGHSDPNAQDVRGWTPLMAAAVSDDVESFEFLLANGAKLGTQGRAGFTALFWAKVANAEKVINLVENRGVYLTDRERQGLKNLKAAREMNAGKSEEVESLLHISQDTGVILTAPSALQLEKQYLTIIERIMESAEKIEYAVRNILPSNYAPKRTLENSILAFDGLNSHDSGVVPMPVVEERHKERPGEGDFPSWKSLIQHSKLFVQVICEPVLLWKEMLS